MPKTDNKKVDEPIDDSIGESDVEDIAERLIESAPVSPIIKARARACVHTAVVIGVLAVQVGLFLLARYNEVA